MAKTSTVSIEFMGMQRVITRTDRIHMPITPETLAGDALSFVREKYPALELNTDTLLVTVNHKVVPVDTRLQANDSVSFVPAIGGG